MTDSLRGLPLLSGPPPDFLDTRAEASCRKCNKEFSILTRSQKCNHCGYLYCNSCSDYQALMPRGDPASGYDPKNVCAFCIQYLSMTAGGKGYLRSQPLAKLKNYIQAYNVKLRTNVLEKEDLINAIVSARGPNGCLPKENEDWFRKHAVPNGQTSRPRGFFSRNESPRVNPRQNFTAQTPWTRSSSFARPDLDDSDQPQQEPRGSDQHRPPPSSSGQPQYAPPPGPPPQQSTQYRPPGPPPGYMGTPPPRPPPGFPNSPSLRPSYSTASNSYYGQSHPQRQQFNGHPQQQQPPRSRTTSQAASSPHSNSSPTSRPASTSAPSSTPKPPQPVPTLNELLEMPEENIGSLSISQLKEVLVTNHVPAPRMILEKSELIERVLRLVTTERREREHAAALREREEWEAQERAWAAREREREAREREQRDREEQERRRRQDAYRTTVEDASASDDSVTSINEPAATGGSGDPPTFGLPTEGAERQESAQDPPPSPPLKTPEPEPSLPPRPSLERSGLCVVCQDEDANMVIIDCGHLALCRACADLVWKSTRECPLCRTRIVTEQRFLRIFKA